MSNSMQMIDEPQTKHKCADHSKIQNAHTVKKTFYRKTQQKNSGGEHLQNVLPCTDCS